MNQGHVNRVAAYTLYAWEHTYPFVRLVAPCQQEGVELLRGTQWDQVYVEHVAASDLVILHRDFPRLAKAYRQVMEQARNLGKPVFFDLDDLLLELPAEHPERHFHYMSDALFPILQAIVEADAVTVSTPAMQQAVHPLNPNTLILPTCLDDQLWPLKDVGQEDNPQPLIIGWIHDQLLPVGIDSFTHGLEQFLRQQEAAVLLRVWGNKPPDKLLALSNVDWLPGISHNYSQHATYFSNEHIDLALVPHGDGVYYRCQSPLRYLEHSACSVPGIYSAVSPYQDIISHHQNGLLASTAEEWLQALEELAGSAELRRQIARSAQYNVQQEWLLSHNAHPWKSAFEGAAQLAAEHRVNQPFVTQAAQLSDQVRRWQRNLEQRLHERDWEVRATDVMMVRKDRQAQAYIEQLGSQLEDVWSDPVWRLLHKAERLVKMVASPGRRGKSTQPAVSPLDTGSAPDTGQEVSPESWVFSSLPDKIAAARTFDLICFAGSRWEQIPENLRSCASGFAERGWRIFIVHQSETLNSSPSLRQVESNIFELALPNGSLTGESAASPPAAQIDPYRAWFDHLRLEARIFEAVSWIEDPSWANLAYRLRNFYDWQVVSTLPGPTGGSEYAPHLSLRADLVLPLHNEEITFPELRQALEGLYPKASIVILTYNNLDYTRQCLESIFAKTVYPNFEVVIVDNASTDGTVEYLHAIAAAHPNVQLILNEENRGFAAGNNQGVNASHAEYIVFLNNDTIVTQGWLCGLITHLRNPAIGAVGPVTNSAGNESKIGVDYSDISGMDSFAYRYTRAHAGEVFEIRMLALYCMLVRRSVIDDVGLLDERFGVGMYEDDDFSLRMRQKGYRILCAEDVYIHHWGSASFSQLAVERFQRLHVENRQKFEEKWGTEWQPHRWRMEQA